MGTFPDNLIDGDKETSITTGGGNGQWWYNYDNDYYGHSIIIDLGETAISELCLRYQTRTSLETLPGGTSDDYPTVTQNGKARPHEVGLGVGSDGSNWTFLGKTIVSEEMTAPTTGRPGYTHWTKPPVTSASALSARGSPTRTTRSSWSISPMAAGGAS